MYESAVARKLLTRHGQKVGKESMLGRMSVVAGNSHSDSKLTGLRAGKEVPEMAPAVDQLKGTSFSKNAIRQQLARIVRSTLFVQSERMSRFLRFIVEHALDGSQSCLKEYLIGSEVYDRKPPYHPSQDSIVRTEARRLRGKLKEYYLTEGKDDSVCIYLRPGSYVPVFQSKEHLTGPHHEPAFCPPALSTNTAVIATAILPFRDMSGSPLSSTYARGIPDELAYTLMRTKRCKVISPASMEHFSAREQDVATAMSRVGAQIAFEGSVREECNHIRVTARIVDSAGFQLWAQRFDAEADSHTLFMMEEQIASALSKGFDVLFGDSQITCAI